MRYFGRAKDKHSNGAIPATETTSRLPEEEEPIARHTEIEFKGYYKHGHIEALHGDGDGQWMRMHYHLHFSEVLSKNVKDGIHTLPVPGFCFWLAKK